MVSLARLEPIESISSLNINININIKKNSINMRIVILKIVIQYNIRIPLVVFMGNPIIKCLGNIVKGDMTGVPYKNLFKQLSQYNNKIFHKHQGKGIRARLMKNKVIQCNPEIIRNIIEKKEIFN